ncbi:hypothetical protein ISN44_As09g032290, partial [Arabidopsis suecica]
CVFKPSLPSEIHNRRLVDLSEIYGFNSRFRFFIPYGFSFRLNSVGIKM